MVKSILKLNLCVLITLVLVSCSSLFDEKNNTSITVDLPYGTSARAASDDVSYTYLITFEHKSSGTKTEIKGKSGQKVVLDPAETGGYLITGKAYNNKDELVYEGTAAAIVKEGENTDVTLELKKVKTEDKEPEEEPEDETVVESKRMKLVAEEKGIRITVNTAKTDGDLILSMNLFEKNNNIAMTPDTAVDAGGKYEFFYPFTEAGKEYAFYLNECVMSGEKLSYIEDEAKIKSIGGDKTYAGMSGSDNVSFTYDDDILTVGNKADVEKFFTKEMISAGAFDEIHVSVDVYLGEENQTDNGFYEDLFYYRDGEIQADYSTEIKVSELFLKQSDDLDDGAHWWAYANYHFKINKYSDYYYFTGGKQTDVMSYTLPELINSKHVTLEPCSEGIKATFKWCEGDGKWNSWTKFHFVGQQMLIEFNDNEVPSEENPEVSYIINTTDKGAYYKFRLELNTTEHYEEEYSYCMAGGGNSSLVNIPESWGEQELILNCILDETGDCTDISVQYEGNQLSKVFSVSDILSKKFEDIFVDCTVYSGDSDWLDVQWVYSDRLKIYESGRYNTELFASFLESGVDIDDLKSIAKYILGARDKWFAYFKVSFKPTGNNTVYSLEETLSESTWSGKNYGKFVSGNKTLDFISGWNLFYAALEEDLPTVEVMETGTLPEGKYIEFTMDKDFDNDNYELQITNIYSVEAGESYEVSLTAYCDNDTKIEINVFDSKGTPINMQVQDITAGGDALYKFYIDDVTVSELYTFAIIPYGAGQYKISDINFGPY